MKGRRVMGNVTRRHFVRESAALGATAIAGSAAAAESGAAPSQKIKILAISCSPRQGKNTSVALSVCLRAAEEVSEAIQTELVELARLHINGNVAAGIDLAPGEEDDFPALVPKLADPTVRGIIIGTPVYFSNMSSLCKAFLDRCIVLWQADFALGGKVAGVLAVGGSRNGGQEVTLQSVQLSLFCQEMIVVGNGRPGPRLGATVWSGAPGGVLEDEYGMATAKALGRRVAQVALRLGGSGH
jgi:multimeric flavodoxin WrbA